MVSVNVEASVEVDFDDVWDALDFEEQKEHAKAIIGAWPELISEAELMLEELLEDPVKRLEIIVALRALGYRVESA